jgi:DNA-binding transcriptional ArsR family regulator
VSAPAVIPELDRTLAALADNTRRSVVELLVHRPRRAGELAVALSLTPPAMSRHLRVLRESGLVEEDHQGDDARVRVYRLKRERFDALRSWLDEVESFWTNELEAFKAHAERTRGAAATKTTTTPKPRPKVKR